MKKLIITIILMCTLMNITSAGSREERVKHRNEMRKKHFNRAHPHGMKAGRNEIQPSEIMEKHRDNLKKHKDGQ